jgi:hypothetical protein
MKKIFLTLIIAFGFLSCDNFLEEELSPNSPQDSNIAPDKKLAAALTGLYRTQAINLNQYGNRLSYAWGLNVNGFTGTPDEFTYAYTTSTGSIIWENLYLNIDNFQNILNFPNSNHKYDNHFAVAKLMKVNGMQYIISLYGDAPYSQAFKQLSNPTPAYDDDKQIFKDLLKLIDEARLSLNDGIATTYSSTIPLGVEDIVFKGNLNLWLEYANTLELKLLIKLSNTTDSEMISIRNTRFSALNGLPFISDDAIINPGYNASTLTQFNPFYNNFGRDLTGATTGGFRSNVAASYIAKILNGQENNPHINTVGIADLRKNRNFRLVSGNIAGVVQGDVSALAGGGAPNPISSLGQYITGDLTTELPFDANKAVKNGASRNGFLMLKSESLFLQSEAVHRGYLTGSAQTLFEDGIKASYAFYSKLWGNLAPGFAITNSINASTYIANSSNNIGIGWDGTPDKIEAIMTQKWLALNGVSGIEPYLDHVRTGFPYLPLPITATKPNRPNRLLYPNSEYTTNSANVPSISNNEIFIINSKSPFFLK